MAEDVGFEPTEGFPSTVFKTAAFNHSANPPQSECLRFRARASQRTYRRSRFRIPYNVGMDTSGNIRAANALSQVETASWLGKGGLAGAMPSALDHEFFMGLALDEARAAGQCGEVPIGAVVVHWPHDPATRKPLADPQIVAASGNARERTNNPAGHAEFIAISEACRTLETWRLSQCIVYVTLEPCPMCAGLMHQARIGGCVFGASDPKAGALGTLYSLHQDERLNHTFEVLPGIRADECAALLKDFFAQRRKERSR